MKYIPKVILKTSTNAPKDLPYSKECLIFAIRTGVKGMSIAYEDKAKATAQPTLTTPKQR